MSDSDITYWDTVSEIQLGSLWQHVSLGYVSRVTSCSRRGVRYERVEGRIPFALSRGEFTKAYNPLMRRDGAERTTG